MKNNILLFILILSLTACTSGGNKSKRQNLDAIASYQRMRSDSIQRVKDSIAAAETAYQNRPWKLGTFVDEFGDATKNKYIKTQVEGTFSNSATEGSYLFAEVLFTKSAVGIFLHNYEMSNPAEKFIGRATIMLKNSEDKILKINSHGD
jgi:hypothetical protein